MRRPKPSVGPRPGALLELRVEKGVYRGLGLARHAGQVVFVPRAFPGERVRARVEQSGRGYLSARLESVLDPAPARREPPCPHAHECGGCCYQELDYAAQLVLKESILRESLARGGIEWSQPIPLRPSPEAGWRMRVRWHAEHAGAGLALGPRRRDGRRIVEAPSCRQLSPETGRALASLRDALQAEPATAARLREVAIAESSDGRDRVAALQADLAPDEAPRLAAVARSVPWLSGLGVEATRGATSPFVLLHGSPHVRHFVSGFDLRCHVSSFFQSNRFLVEPLVQTVLRLLPAGGQVLDLYAGVGLFALPLAARSDRVRAAEIHPLAVEDARANAASAGLANLSVAQQDVAAALAAWPEAAEERVVLDPPRTGAGVEVVRRVAARRPAAVAYVSCDPPTLARDLGPLLRAGYRLAALEALDLFPDTFHLESVALLVPG